MLLDLGLETLDVTVRFSVLEGEVGRDCIAAILALHGVEFDSPVVLECFFIVLVLLDGFHYLMELEGGLTGLQTAGETVIGHLDLLLATLAVGVVVGGYCGGFFGVMGGNG
jgi:hypothetical protein